MAVPFQLQDDSIVIQATVNGKPVTFVLDTGDAIGPVFTAADAQRLGLKEGQEFGVSGAGGATTSYVTTADVTLDGSEFAGEPSAIDTNLEGYSLLGLPFFIRECRWFMFDMDARQLYFGR